MAIKYLAGKRATGLKLDIFSDSLGSSADGTNTGVSLIPIKDFSVFDGSNAYITFATKFNEMMTKGSFSVWINPASISSTGNDIIFDNADGSSNYNGFTIRHSDPSGSKTKVMYGIWGAGAGNDTSITTDSEILEEGWQHLVCTYDGTTGKIYRNGVLQKSGSLTANTNAGEYNARIGWTAQGNNDTKFHGDLYQALVYSEALTQAEITALYNSGTPVTSPSTSGGGLANKLVSKYNLSSDTNDSQGSNNGTNTSVTFSTDNYKLGTGAYEFDGTDDFVNLGTDSGLNLLNGGTVTMWVNTDNITDKRFAGKGSNGAWELLSETTDNKVKFRVNDGSVKNVIGTTALSDGTWYHIAGVYDKSAGEIRLYVNGTLENTTTGIGQIATISTPAYLGRNEGGNYYDGTIDDVGIWNRVLTATEIEKLVANNQLATSGWTLQSGTSSDININSTSAGKLYFDLDAVSGSDQRMTYDLGSALSDTQWTMRFTVNTTSMANYSQTLFMLGDGVGGSATGSIDTLGFSVYKGSSTINHRLLSNNGTDALTVGIISDTYSAGVSNGTDYFIEINRTASDSAEMKIRTGSHSGTLLSTETITPSSTTGLRYLKCMNLQVSGWGGASVGTFDDIKIWNGTNTTSGTPDYSFTFTNGDAQLVSSLTNRSELKAYYSMDSTSLDTTATKETLDSTNGVTNWTEAGSMYTIDSSDNQIDFALLRDNSGSSATTALYDLGASTMLNDTKFVLRFRLNVGTISNPSNSYSIQFNFGAFSSTVDMTTAEDHLGIFCQATGNTGNNWQFGVGDNSASYSQSPSVAFDASGTGVTGNNNWYVEIVRESASAGKCRLYSDSTYETLVQEKSLSFSSSNPQNLRYIGSKCYGSNAYATPTYNGYLSDVKVYNGVSSLDGCKNDYSDASPIPNSQTNTIVEATDDGNHYIWTGSAWTKVA